MRLISPASSPAAPGMRFFGSGGVGTSSERQLIDEPLDPRRVGLLVDAVDGGHAAALAELGDLLVGEDHQLLDQPVGLGLLDGFGAHHRAVVVELELRLE